jgi:hypothetical protein
MVMAVVLTTAIACSGKSEPAGVFRNVDLVSPSPLQVVGSDSKDSCKDGGWQQLVKEDGAVFRNQGECVSYAAHGGVPRNPSQVQSCTRSLAIDGPPIDSDDFTRVWRKDPFDFVADLQLDGSTCGSWTMAWTYKFGDAPAVSVPSDWIVGDTLRVPKWTLEKYTATGKRYTFTLTATPPSGSGLSPITATRTVHVLGTKPIPGYSPTGFTQEISAGVYSYKAFGGLPRTVDPDNPEGSPVLHYRWYAEVYGADEIEPESGQGTPTVSYKWSPAEFFLIRLTVCPGDEPYPESPEGQAWPYGFTGCSTTPDFIITTGAG